MNMYQKSFETSDIKKGKITILLSVSFENLKEDIDVSSIYYLKRFS